LTEDGFEKLKTKWWEKFLNKRLPPVSLASLYPTA